MSDWLLACTGGETNRTPRLIVRISIRTPKLPSGGAPEGVGDPDFYIELVWENERTADTGKRL